MRNLIYVLLLTGLLSACDTKQNWIDTGVCSPYHDCSIMEYLRNDSANWYLTVKLIERASLEDLFEGNRSGYENITFFAPTSYSVLRYVWDKASGRLEHPRDESMWRALTEDEKNYPDQLVEQLDKEWCREMVLRHVVKGKYLKADVALRNREYPANDERQDGCTDLVCESGNKIRVYRDKSDYGGVPEAGAELLLVYSFDAMQRVPMASPDIQPLNGVVHALAYTYPLGKI